jgi:hypothetical protein
MKSRLFVLTLILVFFVPFVFGDEGMWLYNAFPKDKVEKAYGFQVTQEWLDHVRLSSVRFNNGGSGSFVSADGLAFTNHHVGANCIQKLSTSGTDYIKSGFYAKTRAEEAKCPDLELNVLVGIEDVSAKIKAAAPSTMSAADASQAQRSAMSAVEKECAAAAGLRCDVVTLYSGEVYSLYKYKKYTDVRLVFAPEFAMAFFGGDSDNFTYPRYDLDITFFRIYENDKPVHLDNYLRWSTTGVKDNDLIFVSGHPGGTDRLITMDQVYLLRDVDYPARLAAYKLRIADLQAFSAQSPENARVAQEDIFGLQNSQKAITGYLEAARNQAAMSEKNRAEQEQRAQYAAQHPGSSNPWEEIAAAVEVQRSLYKPLTYLERMSGLNSDLSRIARVLVRTADEKPKPNGQRMREFRDSNLPSLEQGLFSTAPVYKSLDTAVLTSSFTLLQQALGNDDPAVKAALNGKTPAEAAKELIAGTKLDDVAVRKQLYEGGKAAIDASTDPLIVLMRNVDGEARAARKRFEDEVEAVQRRDGATIVHALFEKSGYSLPPDAGFTLRLSYGPVKGYEENGKAIPYFTTMGGAFQHAEEHGSKFPYALPESWLKAKSRLSLKTPLNFVSTADIIGGNSGSPTVNKAGEVVGIIFDGNIQSLVLHFYYEDKISRAVSVDSRGILEALRKIYNAGGLANELTGAGAAARK